MDILTGAKLWLMVRPIRRFKQWRQSKREKELTSELIALSEPQEKPEMTNEIVQLIVRHGLTFAGGAGLLTDNEMVQLSAAVSTIVGLAWSAYRKWKRAKAVG